MAYPEEHIARAEGILKELFSISLLAGDRRGIHERLARILPAGAYTLCNLSRGTEAAQPLRGHPSRHFRGGPPRGNRSHPRHTPYGATSRAVPPIPLAYLTTDQREELQRLEVEKSKQFLARSAAREIKNNIAQDERRLATLAQLNLQQAELDQKRAVLQRTVRPPGSTQPSMLTPLMPMLTIENGSPKQQEPATSLHKFVSNDKELSERFAKRFEGCFSNSDLIIPLNSDVNQTGFGNLDLVIPVNSVVTPSDFAIPVNSETIQTDMQKDQ